MAPQTSALLLSEWASRVTTRGGIALNIRPAAPTDREAVLTFLRAVEPPDLRFRFLNAVKPSDELARLLTDVDHRSAEDLIAFDGCNGSIVATAMIAEGELEGDAEVAVLVRSDLKGRGIGWELLRQACDYARARGFRRVECVESSANNLAITLEREQGFTSHLHPGSAELTILEKRFG